jgi:pyrimidine operon attenuation protein/uracil phosphoribosyltransferase
MKKGKIILENAQFNLTINRLCHELIENYEDFSDTCIIGIQEKGVLLADRIQSVLKQLLKKSEIPYGKMDITFYRDDFRSRSKPIAASSTEVDFLVENKKVILIDDVLYTGRTVHAALSALQDFGRPQMVELVCLVDRRFNRHLPIKADYTGLTVDSLDDAYVKVEWNHIDGQDRILLFSSNET